MIHGVLLVALEDLSILLEEELHYEKKRKDRVEIERKNY